MRSVLIIAKPTVTTATFYPSSTVPGTDSGSSDNAAYTLGLHFGVLVDCFVLGIMYYKVPEDSAFGHMGAIFNQDTSVKMVQKSFAASEAVTGWSTSSGWQTALFDNPVTLFAGVNYIAAVYHPPNTGYGYDHNYFTTGSITRGNIRGVMGLFTTFTDSNNPVLPATSFDDSSYYQDILISTAVIDFNIGVTSPGPNTGTYTGLTGCQVALSRTGKLESISIFWVIGGGINFLLGLYSDNAGTPGILLASTAVSTSAAGANTLPVSNGPTLVAGNYWLAVQNQSGVEGYYDTPSSAKGAWNNGFSYSGVLPADWPFVSSGAFLFSLYATLTQAARSQLFLSSEVPVDAGSPAGAVNAGIAFFVSVPCNLIAIRFYKQPGDPDSSHTVDLWDAASSTAPVAQASSSNEPSQAWIEVQLSTPVALTPNKTYYVTTLYPSGWYSYTSGYFGSAPLIRGGIIGYQDGTVPVGSTSDSGVYVFNSAPTYPSSGFNANYWSDPVIDVAAFTIGPTTQGASSGVFTPITGVQVTLSQSATLRSVGFFSDSTGNSLFLGVYTDAGGVPGTLIASSALFTTDIVGLNTVLMTSYPVLAPGTYWVAMQYQQFVDSFTGYFDTPAGLGAYSACPWTGTAMAASWPSGGSTGPYKYSLFATLTD